MPADGKGADGNPSASPPNGTGHKFPLPYIGGMDLHQAGPRSRVIGAAAAAVIAGMPLAAVGAPATAHAQPAGFTIPAPRDPAPNPLSVQELPTAEQVSRILTNLTDPGIPDRAKDGLVQDGITSAERRAFNHDRLTSATKHGELPLTFAVGNIWPVGPDTVAAQVTVSGPKLTPVTKVFTFVDQGGWMVSSDSAAALIETVTKD